MARIKGTSKPTRSEIEHRKVVAKLFPLVPSNLQGVANYLVREEDLDILAEILDCLDATLIENDTLGNGLAVNRIQGILIGLNQLGSLLHAFSTLYMPDNPATSILKSRSYERILERWGDVARCMIALLTKISPPAAGDAGGLQLHNRIGAACVTILYRVLSDADWGPAKEEIVSLPATADAVFALICRTNPLTGKYSQIFDDSAGESCKIFFGVVHPYVNSEVGRTAAVNRLDRLPPKDRKRIVNALVLRAEHLATGIASTNDLIGAIQNLYYLFQPIMCFVWAPSGANHLWKPFYRRRFLFYMSSSLQSFIQQAEDRRVTDNTFWEMVTQCNIILCSIAVFASPNPTDSYPQAIEGGLVRCIIASVSRPLFMSIAPQAAIEPLRMLYPFFQTQKIYAAMKKRGDDDLFEAWREIWGTGLAADIAEQWGSQIGFCRYAYDKRREHELNYLNMCNNEKCPLHRLKNGMCKAPPKVCTSCHHVTYCSEACQKEDWIAYHSEECPDLTRLYKGYKGQNRWPSWKTRRDQLILLEIAANSGWAPLPELKKSEQEALQDLIRDGTVKPMSKEEAAPYDPNTTISCVDLVDHRRLVFRNGITVAQCNTGRWASSLLNVGWHRRIQSCALDAERHPNDVLVVEGKFALDEQFVMWVFAKMTWDPNAEKEKRYKIVTSAFRMGIWKWPGGAGNPWLFLKVRDVNSLGQLQVGSRLLK